MPVDCFGPYLRYAISRNFENFVFFEDSKNFKLFLLVEFKKGVSWSDFTDEMKKDYFAVELGPKNPAEHNPVYATARSSTAAVLDSKAGYIWEKYASRVELSLPLQAGEPKAESKRRLPAEHHRHRPPPRVLIGVLDDGCPFAAAQFLAASRGVETRVWAIWDQNPRSGPVDVRDSTGADCWFGEIPSDFSYGYEFLRDPPPAVPGSKRQMGLNEWIELHRTPAGSIDEDGCYADAGFQTLRFRESHGAHMMDIVAGSIPTSSRISGDRIQPPTFGLATDPGSEADIVFVQFSESCIRDATGVWLDAYVLDGIRYILSCADTKNFDTVIINISYGRTTGPHNGTAVLEQALTALVAEFDGTGNKIKLEIVLATGNSYLTDGHVGFVDREQPEWTWRLPPDNTALCFAEVWMKKADAANVTVTLTSPSGITFASTTLTAPAGMDGPIEWGSDDTMWRLQVEPTVAGSGVAVEYGDYTIKVAGVPQHAEVHGYVARTDPNMDVFTGSQPSCFVDSNWKLTHSAAAGCTYVDGEFDNSGSLVSRYGTLNGIATAEAARVHVAGGFMLANERKSPYSSAGPARKGPLPFREGPDNVMLCDESYALAGVPAGGNRSGVVFRLIGTSAAAPQLARWIARGGAPPGADVPLPTDVEGIEQRGAGNVMPP